jgi:hypothetical protein
VVAGADDKIGLYLPFGFLMRAAGALVLAIWSCWLFSEPAFAERRVALVIGNSAYTSVNKLTNPANDSAAIADTLKKALFDVVEFKRDLKVAEMRRALRDFSDTARDADVAVVYYAGHGMEVDGVNYLIPVDAVLERDIDAYDEAIALDRVLGVIDSAKQLRLVILDACRDNPFNQTMKRTIGSRAVSRGLAKIEPNNPNTLVAFAARAGSTASDGDSKNSPFTAALVRYLARPGLDLRRVFGFTRDDVLKVTNNKQEPFLYGSLGGDDVALVPGEPVVAAPGSVAPGSNPAADIRRDYELALQVGDEQAWRVFLKNYPTGYYADLAKIQLEKIAAEKAKANAATDAARSAAEEEARQATERARKAEQGRAAAEAKADETARSADRARDKERSKRAPRDRVVARRTAPSGAAERPRGGGGLDCSGPMGFVGCVAHSVAGGRVE